MHFANLDEFNKLEQYLIDKEIKYERADEFKYHSPFGEKVEYHQICVPTFDTKYREWDVICQTGSYGFERGLLEIMGSIVDPNCGDTVEGYLTADDVIQRLENANNMDEEEK